MTGPGRTGPLSDVRVLEMHAIGPVPFCAMLLAGMGADVVHVARPGFRAERHDATRRGRRAVEADLKSPEGAGLVRDLASRADILLEGSRPGVMERLGLGPDPLLAANPRLVYGRMTGWGQTGPLSRRAGHDINYIALSGALHAIGREGARPVPPLNLVGDYGGGALFLALGVVAALHESRGGGLGQVVDAAMLDGSASLMSLFCGFAAAGTWREERGANLLDGGAPWYDTYETADGRFVAVGALEEPFWQALLDGLGIAPDDLPPRDDRASWPAIRERLAAAFGSQDRDAWSARFADSDACVTPVLPLSEAAGHPHSALREVFRVADGAVRPAPAPRFDRPAREPGPWERLAPADALAAWHARDAMQPGGTRD